MTANRTGYFHHPLLPLLLLPLYFVSQGLQEFYPFIGIADAAPLLLYYYGGAALTCGLAWLAYRDLRKAALLTLVLLAVFFFFGAVHDGLKKFFGTGGLARYTVLLPLLATGIIALALLLGRSRRTFARWVLPVSFILTALILLNLSMMVEKAGRGNHNGDDNKLTSCDTCTRPDIYLILTDGYAGSAELSQYLRFNNQPFLDALRQRGFHVVEGSRSNYNYTTFSTASLRNFSIFPIDATPAAIRSPYFRTGASLLSAQTLCGRINRDLRYQLAQRMQWESEIARFANYDVRDGIDRAMALTLAESRQRAEKPRLIYTHLLLPHYPYFYKADGTPNEPNLLTEPNNVDPALYVGYLQYGNRRLLQLVDGILQSSARPPIVFLISDHGFRGDTRTIPEAAQQLTLNAVLLPSRKYEQWYTGISNVNHLRVFLNTQFGQRLPLLPDSTYYLYEQP
ncbi:MAG: hypothetical protein EOO15_08305 [Chitinophagaceae bacterium]|nr:MAG: hypothetical protein EOO15_08305 [Chitinophagaceae bacterium]